MYETVEKPRENQPIALLFRYEIADLLKVVAAK